MKRVGYCRTSTRDQDLDHQIRLLTEAGCDPIFPEQLSGKNRKRPLLRAALDSLEPGDELIVTRLSRLSRSVRDLIDITDELNTKGIGFVVTQQDIDTRSAAGRFMFTILAAVAEFEREMIAENTRDGLAAAKARGVVLGNLRQLSAEEHATLVSMRSDGATVPELSRQFMVSRATVYRYLRSAPAK